MKRRKRLWLNIYHQLRFLIVSHEIVGFEKLFDNYLYIDNYQIKKAESFEDIVRKKYYDK